MPPTEASRTSFHSSRIRLPFTAPEGYGLPSGSTETTLSVKGCALRHEVQRVVALCVGGELCADLLQGGKDEPRITLRNGLPVDVLERWPRSRTCRPAPCLHRPASGERRRIRCRDRSPESEPRSSAHPFSTSPKVKSARASPGGWYHVSRRVQNQLHLPLVTVPPGKVGPRELRLEGVAHEQAVVRGG